MTPAEFEDRLHDLLDARQDPLDDAACRGWLAAHPWVLADFARLRERLAVLRTVVPSPVAPGPAAPPRRRAPWLLLAAATVVGAWSAWPAAPAAGAAAPRGRIVAASLVPIRPLLGAAGAASARTVLIARPDARLETFARWSAP